MDRKYRILVVDDEAAIRKSLAGALSGAYEVFVLASGQHFDEMVEDVQPDLVILDVMMPGISGLQLCTRLRHKPAVARVPVLFVSALSEDKDAAAAISAGGDYYLSKPFELNHLRQAVQRLLPPDEAGGSPRSLAA